ncbi:hypothetical protein P3S67_001885 [Capsicum chacoense]
MMMTSGEAVKYKSSLDAFSQIFKNEDPKSLVLASFVLLLVLVCWLDMINFRGSFLERNTALALPKFRPHIASF